MKLGMFMHPIQDFKRGYHTLLMENMEIIILEFRLLILKRIFQ